MQIKNTRYYYRTPVYTFSRIAKTKTKTSIDKNVEKSALSNTVQTTTLQNYLALSTDEHNSFAPKYAPNRNAHTCLPKDRYKPIPCSTFLIARYWKHPKYPSILQRTNKFQHIYAAAAHSSGNEETTGHTRINRNSVERKNSDIQIHTKLFYLRQLQKKRAKVNNDNSGYNYSCKLPFATGYTKETSECWQVVS